MIARLLLPAALALTLMAIPAGAAAADYVPGEVIVRYEDGPDRGKVVQVEDGASVRETTAELERDPDVDYAVPNWRARASAFVPNDPGFHRQWNLRGPFGINMPDAWELARAAGGDGGRGVVVAVLDSGVAYQNRDRYRRAPDLRRNAFVKPYDFVENDRFPNDSFGHGTHVAGTIAQTTNNGYGSAGIAYRARIMPLRVLDGQGSGDSASIARAIRYAARNGADIINLSLEFPAEVRAAEIPDVLRALRFARAKGVLVVAAAGNQADFLVAYPARARDAIAVGATTATGCEADYSNAGDDLDVVAPGGGVDAPNDDNPWDLEHCAPDARGRTIFQQTFLRGVRNFGLPAGYEGTSMAAPHVTGIAALLIASGRLGPDPTPEAIEHHIEQTALDIGAPGPDERYGWGLVNAAAALAVPPS